MYLASVQIFVCEAITDIVFHVEVTLNKLMLRTVTTQHEEVGSHLSAGLKKMIEQIGKKVVNALITIPQIVNPVTNIP